MKNRAYQRIFYFIGVVILITLCIQVYWNYQNFQAGKQKLINEVQISLDNAVDQYYASGAQRRTRITMQNLSENFNAVTVKPMKGSPVLGKGKNYVYAKTDTLQLVEGTQFSQSQIHRNTNRSVKDKFEIFSSSMNQNLDSLVGKIVLSMKQDTLNMFILDSLVKVELHRKNIEIKYGLVYSTADQDLQTVNSSLVDEAALQTRSKSTWLPQNSSLNLFFNNETATILKANIIGLLLSTLLMVAVIGCLLFLLRIINDQKQLAEIKNDLISNITHEFKTPISTISVAMEGILNFNLNNDPEKARSYARTSTDQVEKLNNMVEKLLETATLTGNQLKMGKEEIFLGQLIGPLLKKYRALSTEKEIGFNSPREDIKIVADSFHLENAFNNILDNAVKYGGKQIIVDLIPGTESVIISFTDTGNSLSKDEANQIFDKFYRVPKGNTHDVKGFGIGLYYTKQIIERLGGSIKVIVNKTTTFIIELPYE